MSDMVRCDGCQQTVRRAEAVSWLMLKRPNQPFFGDPPAWHFCSWACIEKFAKNAREQPAQQQEIVVRERGFSLVSRPRR